jgi:hypothetical protein
LLAAVEQLLPAGATGQNASKEEARLEVTGRPPVAVPDPEIIAAESGVRHSVPATDVSEKERPEK